MVRNTGLIWVQFHIVSDPRIVSRPVSIFYILYFWYKDGLQLNVYCSKGIITWLWPQPWLITIPLKPNTHTKKKPLPHARKNLSTLFLPWVDPRSDCLPLAPTNHNLSFLGLWPNLGYAEDGNLWHRHLIGAEAGIGNGFKTGSKSIW